MKSNSKCIYVCHTFYHVYISFLKEFNQPKFEQRNADIVLSKMSNDFGTLKDRILLSGIFENVYDFDEKRETFFPELAKYKEDHGNIVSNMVARILFTRKFSKLQESFVPVDFREYKDIYVYCDNDPIGIYLSQHKIKYHAIEDGLDTLTVTVPAYDDNYSHFNLKAFFSDKLNLIFIRDGFNKYCTDMEVNCIERIKFPCKKYVEVPRKSLLVSLSDAQKDTLVDVFVSNKIDILKQIDTAEKNNNTILILTEPLCDLQTRRQIFSDLYYEYSSKGLVLFKPHPRDKLDYNTEFPNVLSIDATVPMEILNYFPDFHVSKVISIFTKLDAVSFTDEKIILGADFMDKYEDPIRHRWFEDGYRSQVRPKPIEE